MLDLMEDLVKKLFACVFLGTLLAGAFGCGDDTKDKIDNTVDCAKICQKRDDCVTNTDISECTDYCEDRAKNNTNTEAAVDACEKCIDDKSCAEAIACWPSCSLVPTITGD